MFQDEEKSDKKPRKKKEKKESSGTKPGKESKEGKKDKKKKKKKADEDLDDGDDLEAFLGSPGGDYETLWSDRVIDQWQNLTIDQCLSHRPYIYNNKKINLW